jgi:hypothetical protein
VVLAVLQRVGRSFASACAHIAAGMLAVFCLRCCMLIAGRWKRWQGVGIWAVKS